MIKIKSKRLLSHSQGGAKNTQKIQTSAPTLIFRCQCTPSYYKYKRKEIYFNYFF